MTRPLISAHRFGAGRRPDAAQARETLAEVLEAGVELVEMDVRRLADGLFVLSHDADLERDDTTHTLAALTTPQWRGFVPTGLTYPEALTLLRDADVVAHIDLKGSTADSGPAALATALELLAPERIVITTGSEGAIRAMRAWCREHDVDVLIGLSIGGSVRGQRLRRQLSTRRTELFPSRRFDETDANLVVVNHLLAWVSVARFARRRGLPLLVWTVDHPVALRYWLRRRDVWCVTTNRPALAARIRAASGGTLTP